MGIYARTFKTLDLPPLKNPSLCVDDCLPKNKRVLYLDNDKFRPWFG